LSGVPHGLIGGNRINCLLEPVGSGVDVAFGEVDEGHSDSGVGTLMSDRLLVGEPRLFQLAAHAVDEAEDAQRVSQL
jgi:hypothetical protein